MKNFWSLSVAEALTLLHINAKGSTVGGKLLVIERCGGPDAVIARRCRQLSLRFVVTRDSRLATRLVRRTAVHRQQVTNCSEVGFGVVRFVQRGAAGVIGFYQQDIVVPEISQKAQSA